MPTQDLQHKQHKFGGTLVQISQPSVPPNNSLVVRAWSLARLDIDVCQQCAGMQIGPSSSNMIEKLWAAQDQQMRQQRLPCREAYGIRKHGVQAAVPDLLKLSQQNDSLLQSRGRVKGRWAPTE